MSFPSFCSCHFPVFDLIGLIDVAVGVPLPMSFPAPYDSAIESTLDLNHLVKNPASTFFMRVEGEGLVSACIHPGDLLIVDRSLDAVSGKLVVAALDGTLVIRYLSADKGRLHLLSPDGHVEPSGGFEVWGVVTTIIHSV